MASSPLSEPRSKKHRFRAFMAQPYKHPKSGIYQLRRKVPDALREALGREYKRSLDTRDPHEAKALFATAYVECERVFALARAQITGEATYSRADAQQLAGRWFRAEQERMDRAADFTSALAADGFVGIEQGEHREEHAVHETLRAVAERDPASIDWRGVVWTASIRMAGGTTILTRKELAKRVKAKESFTTCVLAQPKIWIVGDDGASPFENLAGPGKPLRAEPPDAAEFALRQACMVRRLNLNELVVGPVELWAKVGAVGNAQRCPRRQPVRRRRMVHKSTGRAPQGVALLLASLQLFLCAQGAGVEGHRLASAGAAARQPSGPTH